MIAQGIISLLAPEIVLAAGATVVLLVGVLRSETARSVTGLLAFLTILASLAVTWHTALGEAPPVLPGLQVSNLTWYVRLVALSIGLVVLLIHWHLPEDAERGDLFAMILFSLTGILLTSLADDLVLLFLAIELVSVPTYVLVSVGRTHITAQEAGVKYFFLGALAAALMVYGFSFLYGASGTTCLSAMRLDVGNAYVTLGLLLAFAGIAFKIAAVPFHAYAPDVYQGAASPVTGLLGFFPKLAGFIALIKLIVLLQTPGALSPGWQMPPAVFVFLWIISIATMTVGNTLGLMQSSVKRMLAYSSIAHSGYMLIGILVGPVPGGGPLRDGLSATLFYIVAYGVMNLGAFAVLAMIETRGQAVDRLDDLAGLGRRKPLAALALAVCVFSLMGMPPTAGFFGKVYLFSTALSTSPVHPYRTALVVLAVAGVVNSAIAAAYYLRIIAACYLRDERAELRLAPRTRILQVGVLCCTLAVLLIGIRPGDLIRMAQQPSYDLRPPGLWVDTTTPHVPPCVIQPPGRGRIPNMNEPHNDGERSLR